MKFNLILVLIALIFCATAVEATKTEQFVYVSRPVYAYRPFGYRVFTPSLSVVSTPVYWRSVWRHALKSIAKRVNRRRAAKRQ